jgi:16S rRNA (adenine1518-N6/adenine1519-N6)-dimethyltransferase
VAHLRAVYADRPGVEIVEGDALEVDWAAIAGSSYLLAGNLPYYITTPLIFRILETPRPRRAVLLVQKEVAERLVAAPGSENYGALTVNVQVISSVRLVSRVSAGSFHPKPKVDSAIVLLTPLPEPLLGASEVAPFRRFVQAAFGMRRKQLIRLTRELWIPDSARAAGVLDRVGLDASARPEVLTPTDFVRLYRAITNSADTA